MKKEGEKPAGVLDCFSVNISEGLGAIDEANFILLDIYETAEKYIIEAEIPGVNGSEIEIFMSGDNVIIKGMKEEKIESSGKLNFFCMERSFGPFKRMVEIPSPVISNEISADYCNGLLIVVLPKAKERRKKRRKILVNVR